MGSPARRTTAASRAGSVDIGQPLGRQAFAHGIDVQAEFAIRVQGVGALQVSDFGLVIITRKRVKQSLERVLTEPCPYCAGGGTIKSSSTICYEILAEAGSGSFGRGGSLGLRGGLGGDA